MVAAAPLDSSSKTGSVVRSLGCLLLALLGPRQHSSLLASFEPCSHSSRRIGPRSQVVRRNEYSTSSIVDLSISAWPDSCSKVLGSSFIASYPHTTICSSFNRIFVIRGPSFPTSHEWVRGCSRRDRHPRILVSVSASAHIRQSAMKHDDRSCSLSHVSALMSRMWLREYLDAALHHILTWTTL